MGNQVALWHRLIVERRWCLLVRVPWSTDCEVVNEARRRSVDVTNNATCQARVARQILEVGR